MTTPAAEATARTKGPSTAAEKRAAAEAAKKAESDAGFALVVAGMTPAPGTPAHEQARANGARCRFAEVHRAWFAAREGRESMAREDAWFDAATLLGRDDWQQAENARVWSAEDWEAAAEMITSGAMSRRSHACERVPRDGAAGEIK